MSVQHPSGTSHGDLTVAQAHIELAVTLSARSARPARWPHGPACDDRLRAFFLISAANVLWVDAMAAHPRVHAIDVSIEAAGMFSALEAAIATGRMQLVICGSGPGTLGVLWALPAARAQGAPILILVPLPPPWLVDGPDIQEAPVLPAAAPLCDDVIAMHDARALPRIAMRLHKLFAERKGAVVVLAAPTHLLGEPSAPVPDISRVQIRPPAPSRATIAEVAEWMSATTAPAAVLVGAGALPYLDRVEELIKRLGAVHFATPPAAAALGGSLGVIGNTQYGDVPRRLRELDVDCVLVLGSRLGTASGGGDPALFPDGCRVVHVDIDPVTTAPAMWHRDVLSVTSEIGEFLHAFAAVPLPREPREVDMR